MTKQIQTHPTNFVVEKPFGPFLASCMLPEDAVSAMLKMSDEILSNKLSESHGQSLAGVINKEMKVYKSDMKNAGVNQLLESCVRSYVIQSAKNHGMFKETYTFESMINAAWIVSQYENEYNPIHNHSGCDISAVIYLKCPDVKSRRNLEAKKGKIDFDGDIHFVHSAMGSRNYDVFERGMLNIVPTPGLLLMFPSYLTHTVYPFVGEGERRSLPFNAVYRITDENRFIAGDVSNVVHTTFYTKEKPNECSLMSEKNNILQEK
tara:strand:- start:434 stop:1222 length:789 start_codon:yes stop_codon:yes gene_type:complete